MMRLTRLRLLSTAAPSPPPASSGSNLSRVLIAAAVAAPVGFGAYKWEYDPDFKKSIQGLFGRDALREKPKRSLVEVTKGIAPAPAPPIVAPEQPQSKAEDSPKQIDDDVYISMAELDEIERILVPAVTERFSKAEVAQVEQKIAEAEQAAQKKEEEPKVEKAQQQEAPKATPVEAPPVQQQQQEPTNPSRDHLESLREAAKKVEDQAAEAARSELAKAEASLKTDIEKVLAKDLSSLDEQGLRERVVQLTLELKDRNRWEALRLHEVITKTIEDVSRKYLTMMRDQEAAYESVVRAEVAKASMDATTATEERLSRSVQERLARQRDSLKADMDLMIEKAREEERQIADAERKSRTSVLHEMEKTLTALDESLKERDRARVELARAKRALQAALRFSRVLFLEKGTPSEVEASLSELRLATAGDSVITETLEALPHRVFASGVASMHKLARTFENDVKPEVIRSSLLPDDASFVQLALARATTALMITGKPSASPMPDDDSVETRCVRVQTYLDKEDLVSAVSEAQSLPPKVFEKSASLNAWLSQAQDRLKVEAAIRILTARLASKA